MTGSRTKCIERAALALGLAAALLLTSCGAGARGSDVALTVPGGQHALSGLKIVAPPRLVAEEGSALAPVQLHATGGADALSWCVWEGALPEGVALEEDGLLHGTPQARGLSVFSVHVSDGTKAGVATLALAVDVFGLYARSGLTAGDAWRGRGVELATAGAQGEVVFETVHSESGGTWRPADETGHAVWHPGGAGDEGCVDVLRARDLESGREATLSLTVRADPLDGHEAQFGSTDVWYVNCERKAGTHEFATDFQAALAAIGLRGPESTDALGRPADRLAERWLRLELLREINTLFLRERDGSAGAQGLPLSFPFDEPGAGYAKPAVGAYAPGTPTRFNEISVIDGSTAGILGTAFTDDDRNRLVENDTSGDGEELGAFVNVLIEYFQIMYAPRGLRAIPVNDADVPALRALLHDESHAGGRYDEIREVGSRFAKVLAVVVAHEIGHSLGLHHTDGEDPDSVMGASAPITPWSRPAFSADDVASLRARLPGIGRFGTSGQAKIGLPAGGAHVCEGKTCHLRLPTLPHAHGRR